LNLTIPYQKPLDPLYHPCFIDGVPHPMDDMVAIHERKNRRVLLLCTSLDKLKQ
jgi:hypothetical protein